MLADRPIVSSAECGIVCIGVKDIHLLNSCKRPEQQNRVSKLLSENIVAALRGVEGHFLWVDSGEEGRELVLFERAVDAIKAAQEISQTPWLPTPSGRLELQLGVHWGDVNWDNINLKVFGEGIQDAKSLQKQATTPMPNISETCRSAAKDDRVCNELSKRPWLFISYSRADIKKTNYLEELLQQLKPFELSGQVGVFVDTRIRPGDDWFRAIIAGLANHRLAVLLIGPGFFASDFILKEELPRIEEAHLQNRMKVFWVKLIETAFLDWSWVRHVEAAHDKSKPLRMAQGAARHAVWEKVVSDIIKYLDNDVA